MFARFIRYCSVFFSILLLVAGLIQILTYNPDFVSLDFLSLLFTSQRSSLSIFVIFPFLYVISFGCSTLDFRFPLHYI